MSNDVLSTPMPENKGDIRMTALSNPTPGPWAFRRTHTMSSTYWYVIVDGEGRGPIFDVGGTDLPGQIAEAKHLITDPAEIEANATLIAEAGTVHHETGLTPQQLREQLEVEKFANGAALAGLRLLSEQRDELLAALKYVRSLISEAAAEGFNFKNSDWADRLFYSQQKTSAAIAKAEGQS